MEETILDLSSFDLPDAGEHDPRQHPYGYFSRDVLGVGSFRWFPTAEDSVRGYATELIQYLFADADENGEVVREQLRTVFARALREGKTLTDLQGQLNELTGDESALDWYGTFQQLLTSEDEFASEVRESFLYNQDDEEDSEPTAPFAIPEGEIDKFVEYIHEYGY